MRIPSGKTDQSIYFVAVDATDLKTRETGLSSFTVQRSRNGAAEVAMTTPTVAEIDATNMPGVYALLIDEDTTIAAGSDSEELCLHITHAGMAPVTRTVELYRRDTTSGQTIDVSSGGVEVGSFQAGAITAAAIATDAIDNDAIAANAVTEIQSGLATAAELATLDGKVDTVDTVVDAIKLKTDPLPSDPADQSLIITATDALAALIADVPTNAELSAALGTADDAVLTQVALVKAKTDLIPGTIDGKTFAELVTLIAAVLLGKASGLATATAVYRAVDDSKNRVTATVDADGNRSAVTLDAA